MIARTTLLLAAVVALAGCAGGHPYGGARAANTWCPVGTTMVCESLFEPHRERNPNCGCSDLTGHGW